MIKIREFVLLIILGISMVTIAISGDNTTVDINATVTATVQETVQPIQTTAPIVTTISITPAAEGKFRVGPSITLRPVTDIIDTNQDGNVELIMVNPSLNDVTLNVDASISVPSGIHVYGENFAKATGAGVAYGTFSVPPGAARTINVVIKADKSATIGSHTISFAGLYYPGDNKDNFQPMSLTYSVTVKEPSKDPLNPGDGVKSTGTDGLTAKSPGFSFFGGMLIISILAYLLRRK